MLNVKCPLQIWLELKMKTMRTLCTLVLLIAITSVSAQKQLTSAMLEEAAFRFSLSEKGELSDEARKQWNSWIENNRYVGIAEVHNSSQFSFFTAALLPLLNDQGFDHFALEMGPTSAEILNEVTEESANCQLAIKTLNNKYGKNHYSKTPMVFVHNLEDARFVQKASDLEMKFWGLDQEFAGSYEMLIDRLYEQAENRSEAFTQSYKEAKSTIRSVIFKNKVKGQPVYCWYPQSKEINDFFGYFEEGTEAFKIISDIRISWDIYCRSASSKPSNQLRANHMKKNFENYLKANGADSKVFVKLGGVHLTHGLSPFRVDDMGKYLTEKATQNETGFLTIRHLIAYRNGKSNIGKSGWKGVSMFLELGRKDQWTVVDLRPFREMLKRGEIVTNDKFTHELNSYDLLLLSPDDQHPKVNY